MLRAAGSWPVIILVSIPNILEPVSHNRLFFAAQPSAKSRQQLQEVVDGYRGHHDHHQLRWLPAENWHLTLRFLGEVTVEQQAGLIAGLAGCLPDNLQPGLGGFRLGGFPDTKKPVVVALELQPEPGWQVLVRSLEKLALALDFKPDSRGFRPHITVARLRKRQPVTCPWMSKELWVQFEDLVLYRSHLGPDGARYKALFSESLGENPS